jgi:hypothetical protein
MVTEYINNYINERLPKIVAEILSPVVMLNGVPDVFGIETLAEILGEDKPERLYEQYKTSKIPHIHIGKNVKFVRPQIIKFLMNEPFLPCETCGVINTKPQKITSDKPNNVKSFNEKLEQFAA